jgi:hypothetical protein
MVKGTPDQSAEVKPWGIGMGLLWGPRFFREVIDVAAKAMAIRANDIGSQGNSTARRGVAKRALSDRPLQAKMAGYEISSIDKQITASKIHLGIAEKDIEMQKGAIDQAAEADNS